jgi:hypothetical protein
MSPVPGGKSTNMKSNSPQSASKSFDSMLLKPLASDYSLLGAVKKPIDSILTS